MGLKHTQAGSNFVPAYQISGTPYVTSSQPGEVLGPTAIKIEFPFASRFLVITNTSANDMRIGFSANGVTGSIDANYWVLPGDAVSPRLEIRTKQVFFLDHGAGAADFSMLAGLTGIPNQNFPILTSSLDGVDGFKGIG